MKFSWEYVKARPLMFGLIFVVFGLVLWLLLNKGVDSNGNSKTVMNVSTQTDPAALAAQTQIAQAQIAAQAQMQSGQLQLAALNQQGQNDLALATLQAQVAMADLAANERVQSRGVDASLIALREQLDANTFMVQSNNDFQVNFARVAYDSATENNRINAMLQMDMSAKQAEAFKLNSLIGGLGLIMERDRDNLLSAIVGTATNSRVTYDGRDGPVTVTPYLTTQPASINPVLNS